MHPFTIYGARGSRPVWGERFQRYVGSTSCYSLKTEQGLIIFDAGTGMAALSDELCKGLHLLPITLFFTHFHLDHIMGLSSFKPFYSRSAEITLMADGLREENWKETLDRIVTQPVWPLPLLKQGANVSLKDLPGRQHPSLKKDSGSKLQSKELNLEVGSMMLYGVKISWCPVWHPQTCLSYKIEMPARVIVLATDREHGNKRYDDLFLEFCHGADILIHDAQYLPEEYSMHRGWGHSTWEKAVKVAISAGVKQLVLIHSDPARSDDEIDKIVEKARRFFPMTSAATQGMILS